MCYNYIHVELYVFFIGVLRVRRVAAGLVSLYLFHPVWLNCCCVQHTPVFQICSSFVSIRNSHLSDFSIPSPQSSVGWPWFWAVGPVEEQTCICLYTNTFLQRNLSWDWFDFTSFCLSMLCVFPPQGLWTDEMTELGERQCDG